MPIEFPCASCQTMLRVPDEAAGKHAKCPQCGQFMLTPTSPSTEPADPVLDELGQIDGPLPAQPGHGFPPDGVQPPAQPPPALQSPAGHGANPFSDAPQQTWRAAAPMPVRVADVRAKVIGPAIGLIVLSILSLLYVIFATLIQIASDDVAEPDQIIGLVLVLGISGLWSVVVLVGAVQMLRMRQIYLAWIATIVGMLPCSFCCVISLPFGIWGVVVLSDSRVQQAFALNRDA